MTSEKEKIRKAVYGKLETLRRKLTAQGIPCTYSRSILSHDNGGTGFSITFQAGENGLRPTISIRNGEATEEFDNIEQGLARIKERFLHAA